ncbi:MAG: hypothetical protein ACRDFQ_04675 [Anaerolineales bacterium]
MIKTTLSARLAVSRIVREYRIMAGNSERRASLRSFATTLTEALRFLGRSVSHQSVKNWEDRRYLPDRYLMLRLAEAARYDWRSDFAADILAAIHPEHYEAATEIGRRAIRQHANGSISWSDLSRNGGSSNGRNTRS